MDEQSLWLAVLIQAVKDLTGFNAEDKADRVRLRGNAKVWFVSQNHDLGSYLWICDTLGLSSSYVRSRLMNIINSEKMSKQDFGGTLSVSKARRVAVSNHPHLVARRPTNEGYTAHG